LSPSIRYNTPVSTLKILFICYANMCRSPMAEAIARGLGGEHVEAFSAGLSHMGAVDPFVHSALGELGFAPEGLCSNGLEAVPLEEMDVIISLVGEHGLRSIPSGLGAQLEAWTIRDPVGEDEEMFVATGRVLMARIQALLDDQLSHTPML